MKFPIHRWLRDSQNSSDIWNLPRPPQELFIQGTETGLGLLSQVPERGLAVVGTRSPQFRSVEFLKKRMHELQGSQLIIISGLARGIDAVAHAAALDAGLPTIAVLGAGLHLNYPRENRELRERILENNGLIVSEFPPETGALGHHFLQRNRMIAAWSKATWVVEAALPSGALNTANWAAEQDRSCFAVPSFPGDPAFAGNQILLDQNHALPFWGVHSLGAVWLPLASFPKKSVQSTQAMNRASTRKRSPTDQNSTTIHSLVSVIRKRTFETGGTTIQDLFDWALQNGWTPRDFFEVLQSGIRQKLILDQKGFILSL